MSLKLTKPLTLHYEVSREDDGRWIVDVTDLPGVLVYGDAEEEAVAKAKILAMQVIADRLAHGEEPLTGRSARNNRRDHTAAGFRGLTFSPA
jgi:predicted RNase H-like HicB family nuclease